MKKQYYIFGAGKTGYTLGVLLRNFDIAFTYIDNDSKKQGSLFNGTRVMSLNEVVGKYTNPYVIIACSKKNQTEIEEQLKKMKINYVFHEDFIYKNLIEMLYFEKKINFLPICQIVLTERCTLKCKKCAHGCYAVNNEIEDISYEDAKYCIDKYFSHIDYTNEFHLIGGEPLLYSRIKEIIEFIGQRYRKQINSFCITTNGTIIPNKDILEASQKYNLKFVISNYQKSIPNLKNRYEELCNILKNSNIEYYLGNSDSNWMDYGFETVNYQMDEDVLRAVFSKCHTQCHEIRKEGLYYCVMARSISDNLGFSCGKDDYLNLDNDDKDVKKRIFDFSMGRLKKGYLDMCNYCRGADAKNFPIPAAEQLKMER